MRAQLPLTIPSQMAAPRRGKWRQCYGIVSSSSGVRWGYGATEITKAPAGEDGIGTGQELVSSSPDQIRAPRAEWSASKVTEMSETSGSFRYSEDFETALAQEKEQRALAHARAHAHANGEKPRTRIRSCVPPPARSSEERVVKSKAFNNFQAKTGLKIWHQQIVDYYLENPGISQSDVAQHFNVTQNWLSTVEASDAYMEYRDLRVMQHQAHLSAAIVDKAQKLGMAGLERLHGAVSDHTKPMKVDDVVSATKLAMTSLGFGVRPIGASVNVNVSNQQHNGNASAEVLANARAKMQRVMQHNTYVTESMRGKVERAVEDAEEIKELTEENYELALIRSVEQELLSFEVVEDEWEQTEQTDLEET